MFPTHPYPTPENIRQSYGFLMFSGVKKGCIGNKWQNLSYPYTKQGKKTSTSWSFYENWNWFFSLNPFQGYRNGICANAPFLYPPACRMCTLRKHTHGTSLTYVILKFAVRVFTLSIAFASTLDKRRTTLSLYRTIELYAYNLSYIHITRVICI